MRPKDPPKVIAPGETDEATTDRTTDPATDREPDTLVTPAKGSPAVGQPRRTAPTPVSPPIAEQATQIGRPRRTAPTPAVSQSPQGSSARVKQTVPPPIPARAGTVTVEDPTKTSGPYAFGEVIGRGGMGEVLLAHDRRIGRDVAVKRLRAQSPSEDETARFLREARIQARLDHPAIVPVYELARDEVGRPYFSMKRVAGKSLMEVLKIATQQRMLRAFADVCRAIDFAHSRGIVHRDLKPSNIVLGEFGEVYVIDWGAARVLPDAPVVTSDLDALEGAAPEGQTLGTPGYMAPEQLDDPEVDKPADIYSLGTILFEILAGEPFHPRDNAIESTRSSTLSTSPATRRPERGIAPELDAMCAVMLANKASRRPIARWVADKISEYLDGDRDLSHRKSMAGELVSRARAELDAGRRPEAMRTASRALALDASADGAAELVTHLMLIPPHVPPPELRTALRNSDAVYVARHAKAAIPGYILIALFLPLIVFNGVLDWGIVGAVVATALGMAVAAWQLMVQPKRSFAWMVMYAIGNSIILVLLGRIGGAFTFVPAVVSYMTASVITYPAFLERSWLLIAIMVGGFLLPFGLELGDVIQRTWEIQERGILVRGYAMEVNGMPALYTVFVASAATVILAGIQCAKLGRANREAQHQLVIVAWHLRQLLPTPISIRTSQPQPVQG